MGTQLIIFNWIYWDQRVSTEVKRNTLPETDPSIIVSPQAPLGIALEVPRHHGGSSGGPSTADTEKHHILRPFHRIDCQLTEKHQEAPWASWVSPRLKIKIFRHHLKLKLKLSYS